MHKYKCDKQIWNCNYFRQIIQNVDFHLKATQEVEVHEQDVIQPMNNSTSLRGQQQGRIDF